MVDFNEKVQQQIERLGTTSHREIESQVAQKRIDWVRQHHPGEGTGFTPRQAFEMLFFEYMGLKEADLPVVSESNAQITWRSINPCPTLDACAALGLDTRKVCREAYEKSTQAFLSQLDPQLRFLRSYTEIRPHSGYCLERIVRLDFSALMRIAISEARLSRLEGNKGYGAVAVLGDQILAQAHDTAFVEKDPSLHAEVNAIRQAAQHLGDANLCGVVLFSTCEPCPMCSSLAAWANITTLVYGASIAETAALGKARILLSAREVFDRSPGKIEVIGGVLNEECLELYR